MTEAIRIRRATQDDVEPISDIWWEYMIFHQEIDHRLRPDPNGKEEFKKHIGERIKDEKALVLVAEVGNEIVGFSFTEIKTMPRVLATKEIGYIYDMAVRPEMRRRGIGTAMLTEIEGWLRSRGIGLLRLNFATGNNIARSFWEKTGFEEIFVVSEKKI